MRKDQFNPKYKIGTEFTIKNLENCKLKMTFGNCYTCTCCKCEKCGRLGFGQQGYLHIGDRVKIVRMGEYKNKDKYILKLVDKENEISDFISEQDLEIMMGNVSVSDDTNKAIPSYPEDFYDSSNGVDISNEEINRWIQECIQAINEGEESYFISSGNTKVSAFKLEDGYEVNVSKGYQEYTHFDD